MRIESLEPITNLPEYGDTFLWGNNLYLVIKDPNDGYKHKKQVIVVVDLTENRLTHFSLPMPQVQYISVKIVKN
jgi:hypothetical protein